MKSLNMNKKMASLAAAANRLKVENFRKRIP